MMAVCIGRFHPRGGTILPAPLSIVGYRSVHGEAAVKRPMSRGCHDRTMDRFRVGRSLRTLRRRRNRRQCDVAAAAGVSQQTISRVERGELGRLTVATLGAIAAALGANLEIDVRWGGEGLDRLLDEAHAALVDRIVRALRDWDWEVATEVSFSIYGERGSVDVVGWHPQTRILLVIEAKSVVPDVQATIHGIDRKQRLGGVIVRDRGWRPVSVARMLVIAEHRTARRRVDEHAATFAAAFPVRGVELRRWLRAPTPGGMSGLWFLPLTPGASATRGGPARARGGPARARGGPARERVRVVHSSVDQPPAAPDGRWDRGERGSERTGGPSGRA